jgi:nucleoside-diphosphate-sugar epimerase
MKIFIAGGTGVLGRRVVRQLIDEGHTVSAMSRTALADRALAASGAVPVRVDLFDASALLHTVAGHDAVINLATCIPRVEAAFRHKSWAMNDQIRTIGSRNLVAAAATAGVARYVQESITMAYADHADRWIDEAALRGPTWNTASAIEAECNALGLAQAGVATCVLRFATLYAADSTHTQFAFAQARRGYSAWVGSPTSYCSMIHADDAAAAVCSALVAPPGVYNVAEDEPMTRGAIAAVMATATASRRLRQYPRWFVELIGGDVGRLLMRSQRVSSAALRQATGWRPRYASPSTGLPGVLHEIDAACAALAFGT